MPLLRELIEIPEQVHKGDFVLRLSEGVRDAEDTVKNYVVTADLAKCFDRALSLIKSAVESRSSKAAYLHGSFGSGKSHFMAMLYLLLRNESRVRGVPELAGVVGTHSAWMEGKKFLLVPYNMIGAKNVESHILGHYADFVRTVRPDASVPPVFLADRIFENAAALRRGMGDLAFFGALNHGSGEGGWGELEGKWDETSYERAVSAPPRDPERLRLVSALVEKLLTAYEGMAVASGEGFVPLDVGLSHISRHAHDLGYSGLILFLDELILWLASHSADLPFLEREAQKLSILVEAQSPDRPIPIVSFIARQRDLRELVGEHVPGADRLAFSDVLRFFEGRFDKIPLGNQNLPRIVEKRILAPKSESARIQIDQAFRETVKSREDVMRVLLGSEGNPDQFRALYPFSPALVDALVAVSSVLQRERTALKLLSQLLVEQRDTLELGSLIPVGDLFDVLSEGEEPFSEEMKQHFENARRLYREKMRPLLEAEHQLSFEDAARRSVGDAQARALRGDDRIFKTLILAALTPEVEAFRGMTAARLTALNHGSIRSPLPGREAATVLQKCRKWAGTVGEIRISDDANPTIALHVTGVDTETILEKAIGEDNPGNRRRRVRQALFKEIAIAEADNFFTAHEFIWRGTKRKADVVFGNVASARDLPDETLKAADDAWKVVLDFPFDDEGHGPRDDYARLERFRETHSRTRTVCWIPSTFSPEALKDLGRLVRLEHILAGERFNDYASHLSVVDRQQARILLENQQNQLRQRVKHHVDVAYGIVPGSTTDSVGERLVSLEPSFSPRPPVGANLSEACLGLLDQMLGHQYPAHPTLLDQRGAAAIGSDVRPVRLPDLKKVYEAVLEAVQASDGRILVQDKPLRTLLRQIASPLRLGEMHETPFLIGHHWKDHFQQKAAADGGALTVGKLRSWINEPIPMGLPREIQALIILVFADQTNRSFQQNGGPYPAILDRDIPDDVILVLFDLPTKIDWEEAHKRAGALFGITRATLLNASNVAELAAAVHTKARAWREPADQFSRELEQRSKRCGVDAAAPRLATAKTGLFACDAVLARSKPADVVKALATVSVPMPLATVMHALGKAEPSLRALSETQWGVIEAAWALQDHRAAAALALKARTVEVLQKDEIALALATELRKVQDDSARLLAERPPAQPTPPTPPKPPVQVQPPPPPPRPGWSVVDSGSAQVEGEEGRHALDQLKAKLKPGRRVTLTWQIEEKESR